MKELLLEIKKLNAIIDSLTVSNKELTDKNASLLDNNKRLQNIYDEERGKHALLKQSITTEQDKKASLNYSINISVLEHIKANKSLSQKDIQQIINKYDEVFPEFRKKLMSTYMMDDYEYIICILIRLNITNKDISNLLCKTPGAISHKRTRLYNKMFKECGSSKDMDAMIRGL